VTSSYQLAFEMLSRFLICLLVIFSFFNPV
jgi:hypothetical protein